MYLSKLILWNLRSLTDFSSKKCKMTKINLEKGPFTNRVNLSDTVLDEVKEFKDLGILTDNGLSWNSHIDMITAKANTLSKRKIKHLSK